MQACAVYDRAAFCSAANSRSGPCGMLNVHPYSEQPSSVASLVTRVTLIFLTFAKTRHGKKVARPQKTKRRPTYPIKVRAVRRIASDSLSSQRQSPFMLQTTFDGFEDQTIHDVADGDNQNHDSDHLAHVVEVPPHHQH